MSRYPGKAALFVLLIGSLWCDSAGLAQQVKAPAAVGGAGLAAEKAVTLAEQGRCQESISTLKHAMTGQVSAETRKRAGIVGIRCSLTLDDRDSAAEFIHLLSKQFSHDPDVLFYERKKYVRVMGKLFTKQVDKLGRRVAVVQSQGTAVPTMPALFWFPPRLGRS